MRLRMKFRLGAGVIGLLALATLLNPHCHVRHYDVTVTDKQVKRIDGKDTYMVFAIRDNGKPRVFKNTDSKLYWKYNSSDLNALLRVNHRYRIKTVGWRWDLKSWYENILKVQSLEPETATTPNPPAS